MLNRYLLLCYSLAVAFVAMASDVYGLGEISRKLRKLDDFGAEARFEVWLPNASDPVSYAVRLRSADNGGADSLLGFDYLIDWTLPRPEGESRGFSAYFHGNHYRYRDGRLQEYHYGGDSAPFAPGGNVAKGVQRQAQFVDLLPGALADEVAAMAGDSAYSCSVSVRDGKLSLKGLQSVGGNDVREFTYVFSASDGRPLHLDIDTNPGQISEQTMTVEYSYDPELVQLPRSEDALIAVYPDEFAKYRQSDFRLEKLPGSMLPEFSARTLGGERYTRHRQDRFDAPVVLLLLDSGAGSPAEIISAMRKAVELYPGTVRPLIAFVDNKLEDIEAVCPDILSGETVLYGARSLARDCGATLTPTVIFVNSDGTVSNFIRGMNKNLADEVLEMCLPLK